MNFETQACSYRLVPTYFCNYMFRFIINASEEDGIISEILIIDGICTSENNFFPYAY